VYVPFGESSHHHEDECPSHVSDQQLCSLTMSLLVLNAFVTSSSRTVGDSSPAIQVVYDLGFLSTVLPMRQVIVDTSSSWYNA
jgi:hypothetical protein